MQTKRQACLVRLILVVVVCGCHMAAIGVDAVAQQPRPRGRIRIADIRPQTAAVDMPNGYNQFNPARPDLLYAYGEVPPPPPPPPSSIPAISSTVHAHIPLLREPSSSTAVPIEGHIQESVVYGNWKPEHPLKPAEFEPQPKQRVYGRLEAMLMGMPGDAIARQPTSQEDVALSSSEQHGYDRQHSFEQSSQEQQYARWREPILSPGPAVSSPAIVHMSNASKAVPMQLGESIETSTVSRSRTTDDNWVPLPMPMPYPPQSSETTLPAAGSKSTAAAAATAATAATVLRSSLILPSATFATSTPAPADATESTSASLNWPADFVDTSSREPSDIDRRDDNVEDYKYYEDTLNSAQMHSELSIPETVVPHLPKLPLNITHMGLPYEQQNAANEPTICVPLTVAETSIASDSVAPTTIELERIYCFPLPKVDVTAGNVSNVSNVNATEVSHQPAVVEVTSPRAVVHVLSTQQPNAIAAGNGRSSFDMLLALLPCIIIWCSALARD